MEFCNYLKSLVQSANCCIESERHTSNMSIGSLVFSDTHSYSLSEVSMISEFSDENKVKRLDHIETELTTCAKNGSLLSIDENSVRIWEAVDENDLEMLQSYLFSQNIANLVDFEGLTLLHRSAISGGLEMTEILIEKIDVNAKDLTKRTALHYACMKNNLPIVEILLKNGAHVDIYDKFWKRPNDYCENNKEIQWILDTAHKFLLNSALKSRNSLKIAISSENPQKQRKLTGPQDRIISKKKLMNYKILKVLGKTYFGEVFLIKSKKTDLLFSMEVLRKADLVAKNVFLHVIEERKFLTAANFPFILPFVSTFQTTNKLFIVTHYCSKGPLSQQIIGPMSSANIKLYLSEIVLALAYIHKAGYVYNSLEAKNVLINDDGHVMLSDFSLVKPQGDVKTADFSRLIRCKPTNILEKNKYGVEIDLYMLGLLVYLMATGGEFFDESEKVLIKDKEIEDFVNSLLKNKFLSVDEVKKDKVFNGVDWEKVLEKELELPRVDLADTSVQFVDLDISYEEMQKKESIIPFWSFGELS